MCESTGVRVRVSLPLPGSNSVWGSASRGRRSPRTNWRVYIGAFVSAPSEMWCHRSPLWSHLDTSTCRQTLTWRSVTLWPQNTFKQSSICWVAAKFSFPCKPYSTRVNSRMRPHVIWSTQTRAAHVSTWSIISNIKDQYIHSLLTILLLLAKNTQYNLLFSIYYKFSDNL